MCKVDIVSTGIYELNYRKWKSRPLLVQTWLNFKTHFANVYAHVQEYQCTVAQAKFHGVKNMTTGISHQTNASQDELQQFLANITTEHLNPA